MLKFGVILCHHFGSTITSPGYVCPICNFSTCSSDKDGSNSLLKPMLLCTNLRLSSHALCLPTHQWVNNLPNHLWPHFNTPEEGLRKCILNKVISETGEGNCNPLQYSCLESPMVRGAWWARVCGFTKESDMTEKLKMKVREIYNQIIK